MKKAYVCAPLGANTLLERRQNILVAESVAREIALQGMAPFCPHQMANYLDDSNRVERAMAMSICLDMIAVCDIIFIYNEKITKGMAAEISMAKKKGLEIIWMFDEGPVAKTD